MSDPSEIAAFERILEFLRHSRGFDFTAYKRSSLMRRLRQRMDAIRVKGFDAYLDHLQVHTDEFPALFNTILINVTRFFRDAEVWKALSADVIPPLLSAREGDGRIRVWSAGCAGGPEAYSIAMLLAEQLGLDAFRDRVKIYATDVDDDALADARQAVYTAKQVADVPAELRARYFDQAGDRFTVKRELRRGVIFGHHDLLQDAPISRVDLLLCRNTLMYFNGDAQARVLSHFFFSLGRGGFLVLGRAEMLFSHGGLFLPIDLKCRIFKTAQTIRPRERRLVAPAGPRENPLPEPSDAVTRLRDIAFESGHDPQIVVDAAGALVAVNAAARRQLGASPAEIGAPLHSSELSYRPTELRPHMDRARDERREVLVRGVPWDRPGGRRFIDLAITPLLGDDGALLGTRVAFSDITALKTLQDELANSKQELETAYEEVQSTNEELETTNEELQSTVEELETTNEELQSTNEELETMNEELQSTNEELQTMNDELRSRGLELHSTNALFESILTGLRSGVVVLDRDLRVQVWNAGAVELWGLRSDEAAGAYFFGLDIGLPVASFHAAAGDVLNGRTREASSVLPATNRKGRALHCRVGVAPLFGREREIGGLIIVMDEEPAPA